jgi:hypothetical protein
MTRYNTNSETKTRRVANLLPIIANYLRSGKNSSFPRNWPRVIDPVANVAKQPVPPAEEFFVSLVISNTSSVYEAIKDELLTKQEGLRWDVGLFFSLPVPKAVCREPNCCKIKILQHSLNLL